MPLKIETAINIIVGKDGLSEFAYKYISKFPVYNDYIPRRKEFKEFCEKWGFDTPSPEEEQRLYDALELLIAVRNDGGGREYNQRVDESLHNIEMNVFQLAKKMGVYDDDVTDNMNYHFHRADVVDGLENMSLGKIKEFVGAIKFKFSLISLLTTLRQENMNLYHIPSYKYKNMKELRKMVMEEFTELKQNLKQEKS